MQKSYILSIREDEIDLFASLAIGRTEARAGRPRSVHGSVAVLPIQGVLTKTGDWGSTSTDALHAEFASLVANPNVGAIVMDIDSPGGEVRGIPEFASSIMAARGRKPIVAVANAESASAAYWLASQASELYVTKSGEVGSIGVLAVHADMSQALAAQGVKVTIIKAGKYKVEANPFEPLSEDARDYMQERVDDYYSQFVNAVANGRGVNAATVRGGFGQGRMVGADQAKEMKMVDDVRDLPTVISHLQARQSSAGKSQRSAMVWDALEWLQPGPASYFKGVTSSAYINKTDFPRSIDGSNSDMSDFQYRTNWMP